jgi:hypothetical protein
MQMAFKQIKSFCISSELHLTIWKNSTAVVMQVLITYLILVNLMDVFWYVQRHPLRQENERN